MTEEEQFFFDLIVRHDAVMQRAAWKVFTDAWYAASRVHATIQESKAKCEMALLNANIARGEMP